LAAETKAAHPGAVKAQKWAISLTVY